MNAIEWPVQYRIINRMIPSVLQAPAGDQSGQRDMSLDVRVCVCFVHKSELALDSTVHAINFPQQIRL